MKLAEESPDRFGAVDVIPFVPLGGMSSDVCSGLARRAGAALAQRHDVPVYLYGAAAKPGRPNTLSVLRQGGFEALLARGEEILPPDYGPRRAHPTAGAVAVGSRPLLIALNVELATADVDVAGRIAAQLRASSGGLPAVQALRRSSLTISDQGQHIPLTVPTGLPVERVLEPPPDAATRLGYWYRSLSPGGIELPVLRRGDPYRRTAGTGEPETPPEQEPAVKDESRVRVLPQLPAAGCACSPPEGRCCGHPDDR